MCKRDRSGRGQRVSERPSLPRCLIATACVPVPLGILFQPISPLKLISFPGFHKYFHCFLWQVLTRPSALSFPSNSRQHAACSGSSPEYRHEGIGEACEPCEAVSASSKPKSSVGVPIISEQGSRCAVPISLPMLPGISRNPGFPSGSRPSAVGLWLLIPRTESKRVGQKKGKF